MSSQSILRFAPWLILLVAAYALGRWHAGEPENGAAQPAPETAPASADNGTAADAPAPEAAQVEAAPDPSETLVAELDSIATAAKSMATPDARTYAFFEKLSLDEIDAVASRIEAMVPGNEQDVLFLMAIRRWAQLDGAAAVARASKFPALGTRINARLAAFESWGATDGQAAFTEAMKTEDADALARAASAVLTGVATKDPRAAVELWTSAPESFRVSVGAGAAVAQIASGAFGTGKGDVIREIVLDLPEGVLRSQMIEGMAAEWGAHYPEDALAWVQQVAPDGEVRETAVNALFLSLVQKDPALAAVWGIDYPDDNRRTGYIAAAVQSWARMDTVAAETWVNEQTSGRHLDGAGYAMAAHFMAKRDMARSFSWIRRINTVEMRAELLGTLGRMWANEKPEDFKRFLDETSLNRAEVEMLLAKIPPAS